MQQRCIRFVAICQPIDGSRQTSAPIVRAAAPSAAEAASLIHWQIRKLQHMPSGTFARTSVVCERAHCPWYIPHEPNGNCWPDPAVITSRASATPIPRACRHVCKPRSPNPPACRQCGSRFHIPGREPHPFQTERRGSNHRSDTGRTPDRQRFLSWSPAPASPVMPWPAWGTRGAAHPSGAVTAWQAAARSSSPACRNRDSLAAWQRCHTGWRGGFLQRRRPCSPV